METRKWKQAQANSTVLRNSELGMSSLKASSYVSLRDTTPKVQLSSKATDLKDRIEAMISFHVN